MELYNKSTRKYTVSTGELEPGKNCSLPIAEVIKLTSMYPDDLIKIGSSEAVEKENEELKKRLENYEKQTQKTKKSK